MTKTGKKIYLAGPIDRKSHKWRKEMMKEFGVRGHRPINPEETEVDWQHPSGIVNLDIALIKNSDLVLANITKLSAGTSMELVYAHRYRKPVVLVCPEKFLSPWHSYHSTFIVEELSDALEQIYALLPKL